MPGSSVLLELISVRGKLLGEVQWFPLKKNVIEFKEKGNISCLENEPVAIYHHLRMDSKHDCLKVLVKM